MNRFRGYHLIVDVIQDAGWIWRPYGWELSFRGFARVIEAVEAGSSRRGAAARFGVSVSSAIRWVDVWRRTGRTAPYPRGGDRRSGRIEGAAEFLLAKVEETPDITLAELQALLKERDLSVGTGTVWRFFDRWDQASKKNRARRRASALTSPRAAGPGSRANPISIPAGWCSSTRPGPRPKWPACVAARSVANVAVPRSHTGQGQDNHLHRRSTPRWPDRADAPGRADEWGRHRHVEEVLRSQPGTG